MTFTKKVTHLITTHMIKKINPKINVNNVYKLKLHTLIFKYLFISSFQIVPLFTAKFLNTFCIHLPH